MIQILLILNSLLFNTATAAPWEPGDVLLLSQRCYVCSLIELEEGLPYSHAGILVQDPSGTWKVLEAWGQVRSVPVQDFLSRKRAGTEVLHRRPLWRKPQTDPFKQRQFNRRLWQRFLAYYSGLSYDASFLWNNQDERGQKLYCSEFIAKFLAPDLAQVIRPKPMTYQKNRKEWERYFQNTEIGLPPDQKPGVSPGDLAVSESFKTLE